MDYKDSIRNGDLRITLILAVPRSVSTALAKSIARSKEIDLFIFQPYYSQNPEEFIQEYANQLLADIARPKDRPLHILIKETCESINFSQFKAVLPLCNNIIFLVRDPHLQALSVYRAAGKKNSSKKASPKERDELLSSKLVGDYFSNLYLRSPWDNIESFYNTSIRDSGKSRHEISILDGDAFRQSPSFFMALLCKKLGIKYSNDLICDNQTDNEEPKDIVGSMSLAKSWVSRGLNSKKVNSPIQATPTLEDFTTKTREQVMKNLQIYGYLMNSGNVLGVEEKFLTELFAHDSPRLLPILSWVTSAMSYSKFPHLANCLRTQVITNNRPLNSSFELLADSLFVCQTPSRPRREI